MRNLLFFLLIVSHTPALCQKNHIGLSMGPSFPLDNFSDTTDYFNSGFAQPGFNLIFEANYIPNWYLGIGGVFSLITHTSNDTKLKDLLLMFVKENQIAPVDIPANAITIYNSGLWSYVSLMVGPTLSVPIGKFQFNIKSFAGFNVALPPEKKLVASYDTYRFISFSDGQSVSLGYLLGTDLIYKVKDNYSLMLGAAYQYTKTRFEINYEFYNGLEHTVIPSTTSNIKIEALHLSAGIAYLF